MTFQQGIKGNRFTHFVKWDNEKSGGRYFECLCHDGKNVVCHDNDRGERDRSCIFPLRAWEEQLGGECIAYCGEDRTYAFSGVVTDDKGGKYHVVFDDGDVKDIAKHLVYSKRSLELEILEIKMFAVCLQAKATPNGVMNFKEKVSQGCTTKMSTATKVYSKVQGKVSYGCASVEAKVGMELNSSFAVSNSEQKEVEKTFNMPEGSCGYVYQMKVEAKLNNGETSAWACGLQMTDTELELSETFKYD